VTFTTRAVPIPPPILEFILENLVTLKTLIQDKRDQQIEEEEQDIELHGDVIRKPTVGPAQFWDVFAEKCKDVGGDWEGVAAKTWAFGPQKAGGCLLIDTRNSKAVASLKQRLERTKVDEGIAEIDKAIRDFDDHIESGFQLATFQGPLCAEPVEGMAYFVEQVEIDKESLEREIEQNRTSQITGSLVSSFRHACRNAMLDWSPRLLLAMYSCEIQASADVLGKVYGVVAKRRGRIVAEEMKEGSSFFSVSARLPVVESFGFADDIRTRTSGAASPQLIFSGYELLDQDPFWVPTTEEELEDLGEKADRLNIAKGYMDSVRDRKGLFVDRKIVEFAEKQRTLKR